MQLWPLKRTFIIMSVMICSMGCSYRHGISSSYDKSGFFNYFGIKNEFSKYTIINGTGECIYTWVDYSTSKSDSISHSQPRRYFYKWIGDFTLCQILSDNVVFEEFFPKINVSFLKEIAPGQSFSYYISLERTTDVIDHIFYVRETELNEKYGVPIVNREVLFKPDFVIVDY